MISFREISNVMNSGQVFTCKVVTYDQKRKSGGEVKEYRAILMQADKQGPKLRPMTPREKLKQSVDKRNPNHKQWYTRNIRLVTHDNYETTIVLKIHIPLIIEFNNQTVTP
jgi:hypothetical protein